MIDLSLEDEEEEEDNLPPPASSSSSSSSSPPPDSSSPNPYAQSLPPLSSTPPRACKRHKPSYQELSDQDIENKFREEQHISEEEEEEEVMDSDTEEGQFALRSMPDDEPDAEMVLTDFGPLTIRAYQHQLQAMELYNRQPVRGGHGDSNDAAGNQMNDNADEFVFENPEQTVFPRRKLTKKKRKRSE